MIARGVDGDRSAHALECYNTIFSDVDDYLGSTQNLSEAKEAAPALTVMYRNQLSVRMHWMQGTHRAQWQDVLCASGALDGQLHLHIRQACSGDRSPPHTHTQKEVSGATLKGNTEHLL